VILLGDTTVEAAHDSSPTGEPEAFAATGLVTGTATHLSIYLDTGNQSSKVVVGIYTDNAGKPGTLLAQGTISVTTAAAWNTATIPATTITAGQKYWIALLSPPTKGTIRYRDASGGDAQTYPSTRRTTMPSPWSTAAHWPSHNLSAYAW
jgi:hypothetical protein